MRLRWTTPSRQRLRAEPRRYEFCFPFFASFLISVSLSLCICRLVEYPLLIFSQAADSDFRGEDPWANNSPSYLFPLSVCEVCVSFMRDMRENTSLGNSSAV